PEPAGPSMATITRRVQEQVWSRQRLAKVHAYPGPFQPLTACSRPQCTARSTRPRAVSPPPPAAPAALPPYAPPHDGDLRGIRARAAGSRDGRAGSHCELFRAVPAARRRELDDVADVAAEEADEVQLHRERDVRRRAGRDHALVVEDAADGLRIV